MVLIERMDACISSTHEDSYIRSELKNPNYVNPAFKGYVHRYGLEPQGEHSTVLEVTSFPGMKIIANQVFRSAEVTCLPHLYGVEFAIHSRTMFAHLIFIRAT